MAASPVPEAVFSRLSPIIAGAIGLHYPRERWPDLQRGIEAAAQEFGFDDVSACAEWLLSSPLSREQLQVLASHLTIGETYFFRDPQMLQALEERVLPELIGGRRGRERRLRLWSAACCSGEEPYTLAILLHRLLPDLADWHVTVLGTDINPRFLQKAAAGLYGEWSFRDAPADLKARYFTRAAEGRYVINREIKKLVSFAQLNLVEDAYPSPVTDTNAMDLIICRNVLMYFTAAQIEKAIGKLRNALVDGGWLVVSPSEASQALFSRFAAVSFPGAILYQKGGSTRSAEEQRISVPAGEIVRFAAPPGESASSLSEIAPCMSGSVVPAPAEPTLPEAAAMADSPNPLEPSPAPLAVAESLHREGRYAEAAEVLLASMDHSTAESAVFSLLARALANQGKLAEALAWCDRWVLSDKVDPGAHYLRAVILSEQGDLGQARASFQRALYLQPNFVLAHFSLGTLARGSGRHAEAQRHFANALLELRGHQPDDLLPESDGLTAGRLTEIIQAMNAPEKDT